MYHFTDWQAVRRIISGGMMTQLRATRGDDLSISLTIKTDDAATDITGWVFYFTVKNSPNDPDSEAVAQNIVSEHIDPEAGLTAVGLSSSETFELKGTYYYDIQAIRDDGSVLTIVNSTIEFEMDISRSIS